MLKLISSGFNGRGGILRLKLKTENKNAANDAQGLWGVGNRIIDLFLLSFFLCMFFFFFNLKGTGKKINIYLGIEGYKGVRYSPVDREPEERLEEDGYVIRFRFLSVEFSLRSRLAKRSEKKGYLFFF